VCVVFILKLTWVLGRASQAEQKICIHTYTYKAINLYIYIFKPIHRKLYIKIYVYVYILRGVLIFILKLIWVLCQASQAGPRTYRQTYMYNNIYTRTHIYIYIYIYLYSYIYIYIYIDLYIYIYIYIYIYSLSILKEREHDGM